MQHLPLDNAKQQLTTLYMHERRKHGGQIWMADPELYERVKQNTEQEYPTHSLYRGALTHDRYHEALGGNSEADKFAKQLDKFGLSPNSYLPNPRQDECNTPRLQVRPLKLCQRWVPQAQVQQPSWDEVLRTGWLRGLYHLPVHGARGEGGEGLRGEEAKGL